MHGGTMTRMQCMNYGTDWFVVWYTEHVTTFYGMKHYRYVTHNGNHEIPAYITQVV
jgi:hypothetical protein